jgi:hypothetical protein
VKAVLTKSRPDRDRNIPVTINPRPRGLVLGALQYTKAAGAGVAVIGLALKSIKDEAACRSAISRLSAKQRSR